MASDAKNKEFIADCIKALDEAVRFFSPQAKEERERWVVESFLSFVRPHTPDTEIQWVDAEPWDILCLGAKFQIKEIQEPDRLRHAEYKQALSTAKIASHPHELLDECTPTKVTAEHAVDLALAKLESWTKKYAPVVASDLDLLVYLNIESSVSTDTIPDMSNLNLGKWRSISILCNDCAFVLSASQEAPEYILTIIGTMFRRRPI